MNVFHMIGSVFSVLGVVLMILYRRKDTKKPPSHGDGIHNKS